MVDSVVYCHYKMNYKLDVAAGVLWQFSLAMQYIFYMNSIFIL